MSGRRPTYQNPQSELYQDLVSRFGDAITLNTTDADMLTITVSHEQAFTVLSYLKEDFAQLTDLCGVDYLHYNRSDWKSTDAAHSGYSRARSRMDYDAGSQDRPRFAVVYHLLSLEKIRRIRVHVYPDAKTLSLPSVCSLWFAANWYEREAYDLFGIQFTEHPDMRRILTDYGFMGHPFRKDFPVHGDTEMRYDAKAEKCIYEPVSIKGRTVIPKVIREHDRYDEAQETS